LHVSRLNGGPLRYNQADTRLPDLLVCGTELASRVIDLAAGR
jgi:3'(2'), 5'-bisphosphate nucleotidase